MARHNRTIEMTEAAFTALKETERLEGMRQITIVSRLIELLPRLDRSSRQLLLGTLPSEYAGDAADRLARRCVELVADSESPPGASERKRRRAS